jgi:hypothetical protein
MEMKETYEKIFDTMQDTDPEKFKFMEIEFLRRLCTDMDRLNNQIAMIQWGTFGQILDIHQTLAGNKIGRRPNHMDNFNRTYDQIPKEELSLMETLGMFYEVDPKKYINSAREAYKEGIKSGGKPAEIIPFKKPTV